MVQIYDTTLRDGTQRKGLSLSCSDKINIAQRLDDLGVDFVEGGWPGSNPKDAEFFNRAKKITWKHTRLAAFGATRAPNKTAEEDANIQALLEAETPVCTLVGKSSIFQVAEVLQTTLENNLRMIEESAAYLVGHGRMVIYDAEHFFDGYKENPEYTLETLRAAARGGAEVITLCDTNGGTLPDELADIIREVQQKIETPLGIHAHNDSECAVANSIAAVKAGCTLVQGTINGYGERCGNANLCSIIPNLELKLGIKTLQPGGLARLFDLSHYTSEIANLAADEHLPYVGKAAFAHKGGIHVAAMRKNSRSYQHIDPELVGNKMEVVVSELSGKGNLLDKVEKNSLNVDGSGVSNVLNSVKQLEAQGFSFEAAEASVAMMLKRQEENYTPPFELIDFVAQAENRQGRGIFAEATVKVKVGEKVMHTASEGNGPFNALDLALRKALVGHYPQVENIQLTDFKVRILDGKNGTAAITRVLMDTTDGKHNWSTVGASTNIIEASWQALIDSLEYGLTFLPAG